MHTHRILVVLLCLLALPAVVPAQLLYVCRGGKAQAIDRQHAGDMVFTDSTLRVGLNECYDIAAIDSITFTTPMLTTYPFGWRGNLNDGESWFYVQPDDNGQLDNFPYRFTAAAGLCTSAIKGFELTLPLEEYKEFMQNLQNMIFAVGGAGSIQYRFVKRTLTRRRRVPAVMSAPFVLSYNPDIGYVKIGLGLDSLFVGRPMTDVPKVLYAWRHPDADASLLPERPYFGTYENGQYSLTLHPDKSYGITIVVDLTFSDDETRVTAVVTRIICTSEQLLERWFEDESDEHTVMWREGNTAYILEMCDMTREEAMENLVRMDLELAAP